MVAFHAPRVLTQGVWWDADAVDARARLAHAAAESALHPDDRLTVAIVPRGLEGVALVLGASALPVPVALLPPDPRAWRTNPALPEGAPFLLPPSCHHLGADVQSLGGRPVLLPEGETAQLPPVAYLSAPGMAWFTSGSTGLPRSVYRSAAAIRACIDFRLRMLPLESGAGVASGDSLAHGQGLVEFLLACGLSGAFAPIDILDIRSTLATLARPEFQVWFTTPRVAELLSEIPQEGAVRVPPFCFVAGGTSARVAAAFASRFGQPLRQHYGSSEGGPLSLDNSPAADVRTDTVGRIIDGVDVLVGEHPSTPVPHGDVGRLWIRSQCRMDGYGFPPDLDTSDLVNGWWPTRDLGSLDGDGYLTLAGRMDDCVRVHDGRLVNLATVAAHLRDVPGIRDAAVVDLDGADGRTFGAVIEGTAALDDARRHLSATLPPWCWPRQLIETRALPTLPGGKVDREACRRLLSQREPA